MKKKLVLSAIIIFANVQNPLADETGLASIHELKHESGRRICMTDHFHDGNGSGKTRKEAEEAARRSWIEFTAFEYGTPWGSYKLAENKTTDCSEVANKWTCMISARPCKRYVKPSRGVSQSASSKSY